MTTTLEPLPTREAGTHAPPLRVAFVANNLTPYRVQAHVRFRREIPGLEIRTLVTWDISRNLWVYREMPDIGVTTFPGAIAESMVGSIDYYVSDFRTGGRVIADLAAWRPDAVVVCGYGFPAMMRTLRWSHARGIPTLLWTDSNAHADTARGIKRAVKNAVVRSVVRACDAILVCGENGARYWAAYGADSSRMFRVPIEPEYRLIGASPPELVREVARMHDLREGRRRLLVCARLVPVKAVDQAIDAFCAIARKRENLDLVILGNGPLRAELQGRVPSVLRERVKFAGFQDRQEVVNAFYQLCDVLVHPATWEPWGVVLLEAAAAGLAIITTTVVGAAPETSHDGLNALVIRPNDRRALSRAMMDATEPGRLEAMKAASLQISAHFREANDPVRGLRDALRCAGVRGV
ncbi:MAG: glycosyltransferase family 4 protein [Planctomycetota bacterium]|nr:glycosyltransferase family 4 protein [Planctomycetota bacterium]